MRNDWLRRLSMKMKTSHYNLNIYFIVAKLYTEKLLNKQTPAPNRESMHIFILF